MSAPVDILSLTLKELTARLTGWGEPAYRAKQVFEWIYKKFACSYDGMSTLGKSLRERLQAEHPFPVLRELERRVSKDGTIKFLFGLYDGQTIETVFIPTAKRATLCVSSQAGCKFGCGFCASGLGGWKRDLTTGEILGQVLFAQRATEGAVTHVVFMGVGEPFDNYDNVIKAVRMLNADEGFRIAARHLTLSTCGLVPGIERLTGEGLQVELSVSLHAPNDALRSRLMPVNRRYPLKKLMAACRAYAACTNRQVTFEYILIKDLTATPQAAEELAGLMKGWLAKVNLIPCNRVAEFPYDPPLKKDMVDFQRALEARGVICTLRTPRGPDIAAACGQLRHWVDKGTRH